MGFRQECSFFFLAFYKKVFKKRLLRQPLSAVRKTKKQKAV
jgi:hypothetical protein